MQTMTDALKIMTDEELKTRKIMTDVFKTWQTKAYNYRAYNRFKAVHGIDIQTTGEQNFLALKERLRSARQDYLSVEMQELLQKEKAAGQLLTPQEEKMLKRLMQGKWILQHLTSHYTSIQDSGNNLYSVTQLKNRTGRQNVGLMGQEDGNDDNIFFSFGAGSAKPVDFIGWATHNITVDYTHLAENNTRALSGFWSAGHIAAFTIGRRIQQVTIYGTIYTVNYREQKKECSYKHPDGRTYLQVLGKEDEIFLGGQLDIALTLSTIERIRCLGLQAWQKIMQLEDLAQLQELVNTFFTPCHLEVQKPVKFCISQPGVDVIEVKQKQAQADLEVSKQLIAAAFRGDNKTVYTLLNSGVPIQTVLYGNNFSLTPLRAAILGGHPDLVEELLVLGAAASEHDFIRYPGNIYYESTILTACMLTNPAVVQKSVLSINQDFIVQENRAAALAILNLLQYGSAKIRAARPIYILPILSELEIELAIRILQLKREILLNLIDRCDHLNPKLLPIGAAVQINDVELAQALLKLGADPNFVCATKMDDESLLPSWLPPLQSAAALGNLQMVKLLLTAGADMRFSAVAPTDCRDNFQLPNKYAGKTALQIAITENQMNIADFLQERQQAEEKASMAGNIVAGHDMMDPDIEVCHYRSMFIFKVQNAEQQEFVLLFADEDDDEKPHRPLDLPFFAKGEQAKPYLAELNQSHSLNINLATIKFECLGDLSVKVDDGKIHYLLRIFNANMTPENGQQIYAKFGLGAAAHLSVIPVAEAVQIFLADRNPEMQHIGKIIAYSERPAPSSFALLQAELQTLRTTQQALITAAAIGDVSAVSRFLQAGFVTDTRMPINGADESEQIETMNALETAVANKQAGCARLLVRTEHYSNPHCFRKPVSWYLSDIGALEDADCLLIMLSVLLKAQSPSVIVETLRDCLATIVQKGNVTIARIIAEEFVKISMAAAGEHVPAAILSQYNAAAAAPVVILGAADVPARAQDSSRTLPYNLI